MQAKLMSSVTSMTGAMSVEPTMSLEHMACIIMSGLLASRGFSVAYEDMASESVRFAKALRKAIDKEVENVDSTADTTDPRPHE